MPRDRYDDQSCSDGAYLFNPTFANCGNTSASGRWQQLITATSFPDSLFTTCFSNCGVYEIRIAPSNTALFLHVRI